MIKAVFFDIDGTLVSFRTHSIPPSTLQAVQRIREKGIKVFIATGRPRPFITNLGGFPYDGLLCANGASCLDIDGTCFHKNPIPHDDIERLVEMQGHHPIPLILADNNDIFIVGMEARQQEVTTVMSMLDIKIPATRPIQDALQMDVVQAVAFFHPDEEEMIMGEVLKGSDANRWHYTFADCVAKGTNKGAGIDIMLQHYGIDLSETMAFGDGGNDIEMLQHVAVGVAMGNASDDVKAAADYVTSSVDEDGIANALAHFIP